MTTDARLLAHVLRAPTTALSLDPVAWQALLTIAHAKRLAGTLALRVAGLAIPAAARAVLDAAHYHAHTGRVRALWEAEMARRALAPIGITPILLKGTAFVAAGLDAGAGRLIGDLDILVPRARLDDAQAALIAAGWEWVKEDAYDDAYYRDHMHELPPLIHRARDTMIDVHHTILPLTARPTPDAAALIADAVPISDGLAMLCPADMLIHAAAHLIADGDMTGGLRNLWDIDRLVREASSAPGYWPQLARRMAQHQLTPATARALRLAAHVYGTPVDRNVVGKARISDIAFVERLFARDGWGMGTKPPLRAAFYVRSHALRMPPLMLARHLWVKWRRGPK